MMPMIFRAAAVAALCVLPAHAEEDKWWEEAPVVEENWWEQDIVADQPVDNSVRIPEKDLPGNKIKDLCRLKTASIVGFNRCVKDQSRALYFVIKIYMVAPNDQIVSDAFSYCSQRAQHDYVLRLPCMRNQWSAFEVLSTQSAPNSIDRVERCYGQYKPSIVDTVRCAFPYH